MKYVLILTALILMSGCVGSEMCTKEGTSYSMSLSEAISIAQFSNCTKEGALTKPYVCNEITGTWWIDLSAEKEGCSPACVVNVETKEAEINWRCTGLLV